MNAPDPIILFFLLGVAAGLLRSELRLPAAIYEFVSILLLLTIGLKGGIELAKQPFASLLPLMMAVVAMGMFLTLVAFSVLRYAGRFKRADADTLKVTALDFNGYRTPQIRSGTVLAFDGKTLYYLIEK